MTQELYCEVAAMIMSYALFAAVFRQPLAMFAFAVTILIKAYTNGWGVFA